MMLRCYLCHRFCLWGGPENGVMSRVAYNVLKRTWCGRRVYAVTWKCCDRCAADGSLGRSQGYIAPTRAEWHTMDTAPTDGDTPFLVWSPRWKTAFAVCRFPKVGNEGLLRWWMPYIHYPEEFHYHVTLWCPMPSPNAKERAQVGAKYGAPDLDTTDLLTR